MRVRVLCFATMVALAACGSSKSSGGYGANSATVPKTTTVPAGPYSPAATTAPAATPPSAGPTVILSTTSLGKVLTDAAGLTLYRFAPDSAGKSACTGGCATVWPPLIVKDKPAGNADVPTSSLGTITRDDGSMQVTFFGHPVYHYAADAKAGDTGGQGFGGKWHVMGADGNAIQ